VQGCKIAFLKRGPRKTAKSMKIGKFGKTNNKIITKIAKT